MPWLNICFTAYKVQTLKQESQIGHIFTTYYSPLKQAKFSHRERILNGTQNKK